MAYADRSSRAWTRERLLGAAAAIIVQALLGYALVTGLAVHFSGAVEQGLKLFAVDPPAPPPPPLVIPPPQTTSARPEGRASAPNLRSRAAPVAAPEPIVVVPPPPPPVVAAPKPYVANDRTSGSAPIRGPGTGAGGQGDGFGSGGAGDGDGGMGDAPDTPPRFVRGRLTTRDLPEEVFASGFDGTVGVKYLVARDGRVPDCIVTRSSGSRTVDVATCRMIRERFRFRPSRDGSGRPVESWIVENHSWYVEADSEDVVETRPRRRAIW